MNASFSLKPSTRERHFDKDTGKFALLEYVTVSGHEPKDVVERPATQADRDTHRSEYVAFLDSLAALEEKPDGKVPAETLAALEKRASSLAAVDEGAE